MSATARVARELRAEGGLIAAAVPDGEPDDPGGEGPAQWAAAGPRAAGREADYELLVDLIREGYLLHYGPQRVVRTPDSDLALLAGDRLYALGLARLAALGDLEAVAELADVISLCAHAHAAGAPDLAPAIWEAGAAAVGWGAHPLHERAKERVRAVDAGAAEALREAAAAARSRA